MVRSSWRGIAFVLAAIPLAAQSVDVDKKIGAEAADSVVRLKGLYEDKALNHFLEKLGQRLVGGLGSQPFTYQFAVTDEGEPNAYALPGGFVFATRGIFAVANSEEELAGVLGHEVIHSHRRHTVKAARRSFLPGVLAVPGGLAGVFSQEAGKMLTAPSSLMMAKHSRSQEKEADEMGVKLAASVGYDPLALERCLSRLSQTIVLLTGEAEKGSYFDDHPMTKDRVAEIERIAAGAKQEKRAPILASHEAYLRLVDGLVVARNPDQGWFDKQVFVHPVLNFRMDFPAGWKTFNTAEAFGAMEPKGKGQLIVGLAEEKKSAEAAGKELIAELEKESKGKLKPAEARAVDVNGHPGFYAQYADKKSNLHLLWVAMDGKVFRMAAVGEEKWKEAVKASVLSLRRLTGEERGKVTVLRMRIEAARAGETVEAFSQRTGNVFPPELTSLLNDLNGKAPAAGQLLKIGRRERLEGRK